MKFIDNVILLHRDKTYTVKSKKKFDMNRLNSAVTKYCLFPLEEDGVYIPIKSSAIQDFARGRVYFEFQYASYDYMNDMVTGGEFPGEGITFDQKTSDIFEFIQCIANLPKIWGNNAYINEAILEYGQEVSLHVVLNNVQITIWDKYGDVSLKLKSDSYDKADIISIADSTMEADVESVINERILKILNKFVPDFTEDEKEYTKYSDVFKYRILSGGSIILKPNGKYKIATLKLKKNASGELVSEWNEKMTSSDEKDTVVAFYLESYHMYYLITYGAIMELRKGIINPNPMAKRKKVTVLSIDMYSEFADEFVKVADTKYSNSTRFSNEQRLALGNLMIEEDPFILYMTFYMYSMSDMLSLLAFFIPILNTVRGHFRVGKMFGTFVTKLRNPLLLVVHDTVPDYDTAAMLTNGGNYDGFVMLAENADSKVMEDLIDGLLNDFYVMYR